MHLVCYRSKINRTSLEFGNVPRLGVPRLPPRGGLGTRKISGTSAKLFLGPMRLEVDNLECRAEKSRVRCQKFRVPCRFFCAGKWGFNRT